MEKSEISLEPEGNDFLLVRKKPDGERDQMLLSESDVITIVQSAPLWKDHILQRRMPSTGGSIRPVAIYHVAEIGLNTDLHKTQIVLSLYAENGARMTFSIPPDIAASLAEMLPRRLAEIDEEKKRSQRH